MLRVLVFLVLGIGIPALAGWAISRLTTPACHRMEQQEDTGWTVVFALNSTCPLSRQYAPEIKRIIASQHPGKFRFSVLQVNDGVRDSLFLFRNTDHVLDVPGTLAARFYLHIVPSVLVYRGDPYSCYRPERVYYQGAIDNWAIALGKHRSRVTEPYLLRALQAIGNGNQARPVVTRAVGCYTETFRH